MILPGAAKVSTIDDTEEGMTCRVEDECWAAHHFVQQQRILRALFGLGTTTLFNEERPYWHVYVDGTTMHHVHEDYLQPIDPDATSRDTHTRQPEKTEA